MAYKLSCVLGGHEMDVRGICNSVYPPGGLISVSRDRTTRVWKFDNDSGTFIEGQCFLGHQDFVAAVCTMPASEKYPNGLIVTGGHDNQILLWTIDSLEPVQTLSGHDGAVCALATGNYGTILSGSWDKTAKVWLGEKCMMTLKGHEQAVWAVALVKGQGIMLTASADRTIKLWKAGACKQTFTGHTDCVRSLVILTPTEFLSSANDNTVRKWSTSGECLRIYEGHTSFVYSVSVFPNNAGNFVSTSEDRSLKIWKDDKCAQTISLPANSVWCSVCLENGDIAVGSSDGVVRVFTSDPKRMASEDILQNFEQEVSSHGIPAQVSSDGRLGDIKIEDLPGPEALLRPGRSSGQNLLIKRGETIEAHQWNNMEGKWEKVGEVVGAEGTNDEASQKTQSGKTMYNGKEYDYVFDVDIQEGKPALKLPYNLTDDPWCAAQQFLEENDLSQLFLDQVANFITTNSKSVTIGSDVQSGYIDPFTGGSRYVPGSISDNPMTNQPAAADPFTGQGSYRPSYSAPMAVEATGSSQASSDNSNSCSYFPEKSYLSFDQVKVEGLVARLKEFNSKVEETERLANEDISEIQNLLSTSTKKTQPKCALTEKQLKILTTLLRWPSDICYPGLDVLRLLIRDAQTSEHFLSNAEELITHLINIIRSEKMANHDITIGIVFRIFSNLFSHDRGVDMMLTQQKLIIQCIKDNCKNTNKIAQIAMTTVLINFAVALKTRNDYETKVSCLDTLNMLMQNVTDNEARFRAMVALGTLIWGDEDSVSYAKMLDFLTTVKSYSSSTTLDKVKECLSRLTDALR